MKFLAITLIVLLSIISLRCKAEECIETEAWKGYKARYNLDFSSEEKEKSACDVYEENQIALATVKKQRADLPYVIGETSVMHINFTNYKGLQIDESRFAKRRIVNPYRPRRSINQIPRSFNWVEQGFTSPVRQQDECGSCYSFSAAGAVEGQNFICNRDTRSLSEQYFLDCSGAANGCGGSDPPRVADLASTNAIPYDSDYPYIVGKCSEQEWAQHKAGRIQRDCVSQARCNNQNRNGFTIDTVEYIERGNEDHLLIALYEVGPILVGFSIPVQPNFYRGGVFDGRLCNPDNVNHAVLLVGYTPEYYIFKNSWGSGWGENGYMRLSRASNHRHGTCGMLFHNQAVRKNGCRNV